MKFGIKLVNKTLYNKCQFYEKRLSDSRALLQVVNESVPLHSYFMTYVVENWYREVSG